MEELRDRSIAAWLALVLFGIYLFTFSGRVYSSDGWSMLAVTESFVKRGEFSTDQIWDLARTKGELARAGTSYSKYGYGASLFAVPLYALAWVLPTLGLIQTAALSSALAIAASGALVFRAARRLQYPRGVSVGVALLFGLATPAWVYAKEFWSESFAALTLLTAFYFLLRFRQEERARAAALAGIALGLAIAVRVSNAALLPFFAWYGFDRAWRDATARRGLALFLALAALGALAVGGYNWVRYGDVLTTGYRAAEMFSNPLLLGLYGLLFSPGKGLFVYVPFLAVLPWSAAVFYRRARRELFFALALTLVYLVTFSTWYYWWGGTNWGPRFLVPLLPFLTLLAAPALALIADAAVKRPQRIAFGMIFSALVALSVAIEWLGVSIPSIAYRLRLLNLTPQPDAVAIFAPQFSPLVGYLALLKPRALDFGWVHPTPGQVQIDWLVAVLTPLFILFCAFNLAKAWRNRPARRYLLVGAALGAFALALGALSYYRDDARFGGNDGYRALLETIAREERPGDVLILDDDARAPFFFNENRARLRWYGLSRDPKQWGDATRALLTRLAQQSPRIWFAFDDSAARSPESTRAWLAAALRPIAQRDFQDGVHLILFAAAAQP